MTALCEALGFEHRLITVNTRPLERLVDLLAGRGAPDPLLMALVEPPQVYLPRIAATRSTRHDCDWRFNQTDVNPDATVALYRSDVAPPHMPGPGFLGTPHAEIEAAQYWHPFCTTCMGRGLSCSVPDAATIGCGCVLPRRRTAIPSLSRRFTRIAEVHGLPPPRSDPQSFVRMAGPCALACGARPTRVATVLKGKP